MELDRSSKSPPVAGWSFHVCHLTVTWYTTFRAGVSSFAYQGTNSHLALSPAASGAQPTLRSAEDWLWQRSRYWFQVTCHPLLHSGTASPGAAHLRLWAAQPSLAYLWDHRVQVRLIVAVLKRVQRRQYSQALRQDDSCHSTLSLCYKASMHQDTPTGFYISTCHLCPSGPRHRPCVAHAGDGRRLRQTAVEL